MKFPWQDKISHPAQLGGIETSVLDNGLGRGTRIAWVNTGTPLRYKVVIDRGLDIMEAFYGPHSLAWLSHGGTIAPTPCTDREVEWLYTFGGGLITTCGLSHIGPPEQDDSAIRGLHGRYSNLPAEIESIIQPDPVNGKLDFSITASIIESKVFGPTLRMRRTLSGVLGQPTITICDEVTNLGNAPAPHMLLYHINFGWPLVDDGADIVYRGQFKSRGLPMDNATFATDNIKKCHPPQDAHKAGGEGCGFIDPAADKDGRCAAAIVNRSLNLAAAVHFRKDQLPCLANWQHWGPGEYVTALEPGTNFPIGQSKAKEDGTLMTLQPGQMRRYDVSINVLSQTKDINEFVNQWG